MHESFNVHDYPKIILPSVLSEVILDMCVCVCMRAYNMQAGDKKSPN